MSIPWLVPPIRALLLADTTFVSLCSRVASKAPAEVTTPYAVIQIPGNITISGDSVASGPLIQVSAWCPADYATAEAEGVVWDIAARAAWVIGRARNVTYTATAGTISYSGRHTDGPLAHLPDTSRGTSVPLLGALIRAELTVKVQAP